MNPGAEMAFNVTVTPQQEPGQTNIYVFVNDSEDNMYECYLFKIDYQVV